MSEGIGNLPAVLSPSIFQKVFVSPSSSSSPLSQPVQPAASPKHKRHTTVGVSGCDCILPCPLPLTKCHYAFHHKLNSYRIHPESPLMKSRSSAEFQKECQNLPPLYYPIPPARPWGKTCGEETLSSEFVMLLSQLWLTLNVCTHQRK